MSTKFLPLLLLVLSIHLHVPLSVYGQFGASGQAGPGTDKWMGLQPQESVYWRSHMKRDPAPAPAIQFSPARWDFLALPSGGKKRDFGKPFIQSAPDAKEWGKGLSLKDRLGLGATATTHGLPMDGPIDWATFSSDANKYWLWFGGVIKLRDLKTTTWEVSIECAGVQHTAYAAGKIAVDGLGKEIGTLRILKREPKDTTIVELRTHDCKIDTYTLNNAGDLVAAAGADKSIVVVKISNREKIHSFKMPELKIEGLCFIDDDKVLAAITPSSFKLWDVESGKPIRTISRHPTLDNGKEISALGMTSDRKWIGMRQGGNALVLDAVTGSVSMALQQHRGQKEIERRPHELASLFTRCYVVSEDGKGAAWWENLGNKITVQRWGMAQRGDPSVGKERGPFSEFESLPDDWPRGKNFTAREITVPEHKRILLVSISSDGKVLAVTEDGTAAVSIWNTETGVKQSMLEGAEKRDPFSEGVGRIALSGDGSLAAVARYRRVDVWDARTGKGTHVIYHPDLDRSGQLRFSADGSRLLSWNWSQLQVFDLKSGKTVESFSRSVRPVVSVGYHGPEPSLVSASVSGEIDIWDNRIGIKKASWRTSSEAGLTALSVSDSGNLLARSAGKEAQIWDMKSQKQIAKTTGHDGDVLGIAFSSDGTKLATVNGGKSLRLWNVPAATSAGEPLLHDAGVSCVAFQPSGAGIASGCLNGEIWLWQGEGFREKRTVAKHEGPVYALAFSSDGKLLVSAGADKVIRVWDMTAGKSAATMKGHDKAIRSLSLRKGNDVLASAGDDRSIRLWDMKRFVELASLIGHADEVNSVAFTPEGTALATAGEDFLINLWSIPQDVPAADVQKESPAILNSPADDRSMSGYVIWSCLGIGLVIAMVVAVKKAS